MITPITSIYRPDENEARDEKKVFERPSSLQSKRNNIFRRGENEEYKSAIEQYEKDPKGMVYFLPHFNSR